MRLPIAWLRDYVEPGIDSDAIAERFAQLGFPVENIERRPKLSGVVVGRLAKVEKHPNADRLSLCSVDVGSGTPLTIATAATNVAEGNVVPVATIGAELVGLTIAPREMRGVASQGMLCSAAELGLPAEWFEDGILQLETTLSPGADFVELFRLNDDVLEVEVTANRVDALSVFGLARELAAALGKPLVEPELAVPPSGAPDDGIAVVLESPDCRAFVAQRFSNARVRPAPFWMRVRLALAGQRPIDNLVDISNFVMFETAQPLHFYDYERIAGKRLIARDARAGEKLRTLDGEERALDPSVLVIADEREAQGVAGIKGGAASEISPSTNEVVLEAATFSGPRIRRTGLALGLRTEASTRHEKGLPPALARFAAARAAKLMADEGAVPHAPVIAGAAPADAAPIQLAVERVRTLLGIELDAATIERALRSLGFAVSHEQGSDAFDVRPPFWRNDVRIPEDIVEEVGRIVGYDRIAALQPPVFAQDVSSKAYEDEKRTARALAGAGYREAVTFALQPASVHELYERAGVTLAAPPVEIENPLSEDQRFLRFSLLPGLLALVAKYESYGELRYFEIGHVFEGAPEPFETAMACWLLATPAVDEPAWRDAGFLSFKGDSLAIARTLAGRAGTVVSAHLAGLHPGKTASVLIDGNDVATIGAVDPRVLAAYGIEGRVYAGFLRLANVPEYRVPRYRAPSRFPSIERDLALIVAPDIPAMDIEHAIRAGGNGILAGVRVFDEYRGPQIEGGKKSIAVRIVLQRDDATLTDAEADERIKTILASLAERCDARIRS